MIRNNTLVAFLVLFLVVPVLTVNAAIDMSEGTEWKVNGEAVSGAVGDTVPINFSINYVSDRCADAEIEFVTTDEARQKVVFVGSAIPARNAKVGEERVEWFPAEIEAGVDEQFQVQARIDRGLVGDEIDGFYLHAWCPTSGLVHGVVDDIKIKIVAQKQEALPTPKVTAVPTPVPTSVPATVTTTQPIPVVVTQPVMPTATPNPINPADFDGDGLPNDEEIKWGSDPYKFDSDGDGMPDGDEVRNGTNPAGDVVETVVEEKSFVGKIFSGIAGRFRTIGNWFSGLF